MANDNVIQVGDDTFESAVLRSDLPVLVDFWAVWCGPCKAIAPVVAKVAGDYTGRARVAKIDVDQARDVATRYHIRSIPTLIVFKGGEVVDQVVGAVSESRLRSMLDSAIE